MGDLYELLKQAEHLKFVQRNTHQDLLQGKVMSPEYLQKCKLGAEVFWVLLKLVERVKGTDRNTHKPVDKMLYTCREVNWKHGGKVLSSHNN